MKNKERFTGIFCLPVTPFTKGDIDEEVLRSIIDIIIEDGADGLVPTGATGEFPYLLHEERKKVQEIVLDQANGRVPVIAGTGATNTKEALILTKYAKDIGCDGVMLSHPILLRATDDQTYSYYEKIATSVDIPIVMYNNPNLGQSMRARWFVPKMVKNGFKSVFTFLGSIRTYLMSRIKDAHEHT